MTDAKPPTDSVETWNAFCDYVGARRATEQELADISKNITVAALIKLPADISDTRPITPRDLEDRAEFDRKRGIDMRDPKNW